MSELVYSQSNRLVYILERVSRSVTESLSQRVQQLQVLISMPKKIVIELHALFDGRFDRDLSGKDEDGRQRSLDQQKSDEQHVDEHFLHFVLDKQLELVLGHSDVVHSVRLLVVASEPALDERGAWHLIRVKAFAELVANADQVVGDVEHLEVRIRLLKREVGDW